MTKGQRFLKETFKKAGLLLRVYTANTDEDLRRILLLKHYNISLLMDVGANKGQYAKSIFQDGFSGRIVSFEPLSSAQEVLQKDQAKNDRWTIAPRCAVGAINEMVDIHISENSVSSSLLPMLDSHYDADQASKIIGKEQVEVKPLNQLLPEYAKSDDRIFVKIDAQGFEKNILEGASDVISRIQGFEVEISHIPLYENQVWLFHDTLKFMDDHGFHLKSLTPAFTNPTTGMVLQSNAIFFRDEKKH